MVTVMHRMWQRQLIGSLEGNASVRLDSGDVLCTPAGVAKETLTEDCLGVVNLFGDPKSADFRPSSEIGLHIGILKDRLDIMAIIHAHPLAATAFAYSNEPFPVEQSDEGMAVLGTVAKVPYGAAGSPDLYNQVAKYIHKSNVLLLQNHGAVCCGASLEIAYQRMETLERLARVFLGAQLLGGMTSLPNEKVRSLAAWLDQA